MFPYSPGCRGALSTDVLASTLRTIARAAGVAGAGLILICRGAPKAIGGSCPDGARLERAQVGIGSGPAFRCMISGTPVAVPDLPAGYPGGHPELAPFAGPVHAVLSVPIHVRNVAAGSLDLYDRAPHPWSPDQVRAGQELAEIVAGVLRLLAARRTAGVVSAPSPGVTP